jgi:hypothetical protein
MELVQQLLEGLSFLPCWPPPRCQNRLMPALSGLIVRHDKSPTSTSSVEVL